MAVGFRSSSRSGASDAFSADCVIPVPTGAASGDIALAAVERYDSTATYTGLPTGFTQFMNIVNLPARVTVFWKRLTAADTGNYTFTASAANWCAGVCILVTGAVDTGNPYGASGTGSSTGTGTTVGTSSATSTGEPFLAHFVANDTAATGTPPTSFTETQENEYIRASYRIPATTGSHSAASATLSTTAVYASALVAIEPPGGAAAASLVIPRRLHIGALLDL